MKTYGKMLKKVFGVATVCVAFGMTNLKATFEQDLHSVCMWFNLDPEFPEFKDIRRSLNAYRKLYRSFQGDVVVKVKEFQKACWKDERDEVKSEEIPYWPTKSEFGVLKQSEDYGKMYERFTERIEKFLVKDCWMLGNLGEQPNPSDI